MKCLGIKRPWKYPWGDWGRNWSGGIAGLKELVNHSDSKYNFDKRYAIANNILKGVDQFGRSGRNRHALRDLAARLSRRYNIPIDKRFAIQPRSTEEAGNLLLGKTLGADGMSALKAQGFAVPELHEFDLR